MYHIFLATSCSYGDCREISKASKDGDSLDQSHFFCCLYGDFADFFGCQLHRWELIQIFIQAGGMDDFVIIRLDGRIAGMEKVIGRFCGDLSGSLPFKIGVQSHDYLGVFPDFRLIFLYPHQARPVLLPSTYEEASRLVQTFCLGAGSGIHPDQTVAQYVSICVYGYNVFPRCSIDKSDDLIGFDTSFCDYVLGSLADRFPKFFRILFGPAWIQPWRCR